ncbi:MAG: FAD-dependent oxidoreductase, partial [Bacilli bacterium]
AKARVLRVPGHERAISAIDYLNKTKEVGDNVVIIGGSLTGCEIAYDLCLKGKKPTIVEMKDDLIAAHGVCLANSSYLRDYFKLHKTPVYLESKIKEIKNKSAVITTKDGKEVNLPCNDVIMCVGYQASPIISTKKTHLIGDCNKVGNIMSAVWNAWDVAMKI